MKFDIKGILEGLNNTIFVKEEVEKVAKERLAICAVCPSNSQNDEGPGINLRPDAHCKECGCNLHMKTRSLSSQCPLQKWLALANQEEADKIKEVLKKDKNK